MIVSINNCNNIQSAEINIVENKLNIKLAPNGTGKSTISKAILLESKGSTLNELTPFKYRGSNEPDNIPSIKGLEGISSVLCFNEEYIGQFVFQQDELLSNSFDILIRNDQYKELESQIESLVSDVKQVFTNNQDLDYLINTLVELGKAFKLTNSGISKASTGIKALSSGNKIKNIPAGLELYQPFIQSNKSIEWVDWQTKGNSFNELSTSCPYCTSETAEKTEQIQKVAQEYDKNTIKHLVSIIEVTRNLGQFLSEDAKTKLTTITTLNSGLEQEHIDYLISISRQIDNLTKKLQQLRTLSGFDFTEEEDVTEKLNGFRLGLDFYDHLNSDHTRLAIEPINNSIDEIISRAGVLKGKINHQRNHLRQIIQKHQLDINNFLASAGYKYQVKIAGSREQARLKLYHIDYPEHLSGGTQHLSFGEKNAFAIVLFMYECLAKRPDIIILDDPISSFDKNKKYAILEMLFRRDSELCLKSKTVLMLTHDVEPIIDTVKSLSRNFQGITRASFLQLREGVITEKEIRKDNIQTFSNICKSVIQTQLPDLIKLIYLRRHFEILDDSCDAYQVLSNLFHKRPTLIDTRELGDNREYPELEPHKLLNGCNDIKEHIPQFDYNSLLNILQNDSELMTLYSSCQNGYEKLQVFRFFELNIENSVLKKFINETYHIENEFIAQLNPMEYDIIPEYIIQECDNLLFETVGDSN
ncbi:AAA family ATPase [Roseivirga thermotolerans]|uniref:Protein CR006 P-loop domain-containing protein n=1 Tax=Roseivirga thermotolerans TaxID=1758176 RepID=A0ABQ3I910_9BACT|nr:AAA family ATPase [Roseivirga thermotolerans]GHE72981.1 hypothetical protein GCM10011340_31810 [Roseivirga thermotolerans]